VGEGGELDIVLKAIAFPAPRLVGGGRIFSCV